MSSDSVDIKLLVDYLKSPPFNRSESLVGFSSKSPIELLQVVNDVFAELDKSHSKDIRDEEPTAMAARMLEFLTLLGYKVDGDIGAFGESFIGGSPSVIYPFLLWMLERLDSLKKRAFIGKYLKHFEIPEEYFADNAVVSMYAKLQEKQAEFKEVHKQLEKSRETAFNPTELQKEVEQLSNEREQLQNKLQRLQDKVKTDSEFQNVNFQSMLSVTNKLRQEQEEEHRLYQQLLEQKQRLARAEQIRVATMKKFQEMNHSDMARMDPNKLIARLRDEVNQRREYAENKLENSIMEKEKALKHLSKLASSSSEYSSEDVHELEHEVNELRAAVSQLLERREESAAQNDSKISFIRDRLVAVDKKKEKLLESLTELEDEKKESETDLKKLNTDLRSLLGDGSKPKTDAQMKQYMNDLAAKTSEYKRLKHDLEVDRSEVQVLQRTEEILRTRDTNIAEFNAEQEKRLGITGYQATQEHLEAVSNLKGSVDNAKGQTLEEISAIVEQITQTLKEKKNKTAPMIKELRSVRQKYEEVEAVYKQKKQQFENIALGFESERLKLEQDVSNHTSGVSEEESSYHFLNCLSSLNSVRFEQVAAEAKYANGQGRLNQEFKTYKDMYEKAILEQENTAKQLRNDKKSVTEKHDDHVSQRAMFTGLRTLLGKKLQIARDPYANTQQQHYQQHQQHNYLGVLDEESERMVME